MNINRPLVRLAALGASGAMVLAAAPAMAKPPVRPGVVTNMTFTATAPAYHLASAWSAAKNATSYQVKLTNAAGTVLDTGRVTTLSWSDDIAPSRAPLGSTLSLAVTSYNGTRKGPTATKNLFLPDVTAPTGDYTATVSGYTATLSQVSLSDDSNGAVTRSVNWGDGSQSVSWTTGSTLTHPYGAVGTYNVTVTLKDPSGNTATVTRSVVVVDHAPTGTFAVSWVNSTGDAQVVATVKDDIDPASAVTGTIDWDGAGPLGTESFTGSGTLTHSYAKAAARYVPVVVLTDGHGNESAPMETPAIVINDTVAPTGTFALDRATAWAKYTPVTLTQKALSDNWTPGTNITRSVNWGDGTIEPWAAGTSLSHVYQTAKAYTPIVTLKDEAGNTSTVAAGTVAVATDATAPVVKFRYPKKPRNVVKKWRTLHGTVTDAGVGAKQVQLKAIEKRGRAWYAYKPTTHRWVKAGTMRRAWTRAGAALITPSATGTWGERVVGLRKGTLTYRARAVDNLGNTSGWLVHGQKLTR